MAEGADEDEDSDHVENPLKRNHDDAKEGHQSLQGLTAVAPLRKQAKVATPSAAPEEYKIDRSENSQEND